MITEISDLENAKLCDILDLFSFDCTVYDYNNDYIYICNDKDMFRIERKYVSPHISSEEAVKHIKHFETREGHK